MQKIIILIAIVFSTVFSTSVVAQPQSGIYINGNSEIEKALSSLMNDLNLTSEQKLVLGMIILKHSLEFDYKGFDEMSKAAKYSRIRSVVKEIDGEVKEVLTKEQYKIYKKHKKAIKKQMMSGD